MIFGYGINFKYECLLPHSMDRFCGVAKFILPTMDNIKISPITFDMNCSYLNVELDRRIHVVKHILHMKNFYVKIVPYIFYYKKKIDYCNKTYY